MRTLTAGFTTEKNKKTGLSPVWILKCPFPSTGTIYISDVAFTFPHWAGGAAVLALVANWGNIDEAISSALGMTKVADFSLDVIVDPDAAPNLETILWTDSNNIETTDLELYLWFRDLDDVADPPLKVWTGNIIDFNKNSELIYTVQLVDQSVKYDKYIGTKISLTDYPNADPNEVGKVKNIIYGSVVNVPAHALESGAVTSLVSGITADQTDFYLSSGTGLTNGNVIQIDDEQIYISNISGNHVLLGFRAVLGTIATIHSKGATVWEVLLSDPFVYMFADHPVKSIGNIYVQVQGVLVDITSECTKYTGQVGSSYAGYGGRYSGKAVVTITNYPAIQQKINLALVDPLTVNNGQAADNVGVNDTTGYSTTPQTRIVNPTNAVGFGYYWFNLQSAVDGSTATSALWHVNNPFSNWTDDISIQFPNLDPGEITESRYYFLISIVNGGIVAGNVRCHVTNCPGAGSYSIPIVGDAPQVQFQFRYMWQGSGQRWDDGIAIAARLVAGTSFIVLEVWKEVDYIPVLTKVGAVTKTGGVSRQTADKVSISGNSTANSLIGRVLIDGDGYPDDAVGTITGTPSALIQRPDHIFKHCLYTYLGFPTANFLTNAETQFAGNGFNFGGVINEYKTFKDRAASWAWQSRCYFRFSEGKAKLLWRPDSIV